MPWRSAPWCSPRISKVDASEFAARRQRLADALAGRRTEAMLVSAAPNVRYLSGFTGDNAALLVLPGKALLFTDPRYAVQARQQTQGGAVGNHGTRW